MRTFRPRRAVLFAAVLAASALFAAPAAAQPATREQRTLLSPRDTVELSLEGARVRVDYGRPSMRGRRIMGGLVPFGRVWRTGANAATTLITDADLRIGDAVVPRGTYTIFTLPGEREWLLIVNRQTGQWGTEYNATRDLVRIPMRSERLRQPVEQFTIKLERGANGVGTMALEWESTRATVPVRPAARAQARRRR